MDLGKIKEEAIEKVTKIKEVTEFIAKKAHNVLELSIKPTLRVVVEGLLFILRSPFILGKIPADKRDEAVKTMEKTVEIIQKLGVDGEEK